MKITIWEREIGEGFYQHNHIENGWQDGDKPIPLKDEFVNQKAWVKYSWKKYFGYLINGKVVL